jgi:type IV pilus assembly protein PilQ
MRSLVFALVMLLPVTGMAVSPRPAPRKRASQDLAAVSPAEEKLYARSRGYSGRRIDVDFKNADIRDVLGILADVGGVVIVATAAVKSRVSIRMRNTPWEEVLETLTRKNGLSYDREGKIIHVRKGR